MADGPRPLPSGAGTPRVAALDALLREIDGLRLALETDLTLAAGAVEAGSPELAAQLLAGDRRDLVDFERRALGHLRDLEAADAVPAPVAAPAPVPAPVVVPLRPRRLSRLLPAAPLVAAAAAVVGLLGGLPSEGSGSDVASAAVSSWEELDRLTRADAPTRDVAAAARSLNADIATLLAHSAGDPATARQALAILQGAQLVLAADDDADELQGVLAQSRALAAQLAAVLPLATRPGLLPPTVLPGPVASLLQRLPSVVRPTSLPTALPSARVSPPPRATPQPAPVASRATPATTPTAVPARSRETAAPGATPRPSPSPQLLPEHLESRF